MHPLETNPNNAANLSIRFNYIVWSKHEENKLIELTKHKTLIEIDWNNILIQFPHRSMDAINSKQYELCIAKIKKITKVAIRFSFRVAKSKNNNGH